MGILSYTLTPTIVRHAKQPLLYAQHTATTTTNSVYHYYLTDIEHPSQSSFNNHCPHTLDIYLQRHHTSSYYK